MPKDIRLIAPDQCPVCGAKVSGGGSRQIYYVCGGHLWIEKSRDSYIIKGHCDGGFEKQEIIKTKE